MYSKSPSSRVLFQAYEHDVEQMVFSRRRALVAMADGVWTTRVSSAGEMGCSERLSCEGERLEHKEKREWVE